ncbi:hypothetical protein E4T56_gene10586 [Termitomyces sp. T112]|nr:hypothetical protein E4T56_gene10586 [Termitomyces sp. T112]
MADSATTSQCLPMPQKNTQLEIGSWLCRLVIGQASGPSEADAMEDRRKCGFRRQAHTSASLCVLISDSAQAVGMALMRATFQSSAVLLLRTLTFIRRSTGRSVPLSPPLVFSDSLRAECVSRFTSPSPLIFFLLTLLCTAVAVVLFSIFFSCCRCVVFNLLQLLPLCCFQSSSIFRVTYIFSFALPPLPVSILFVLN